MIIIVGINLCTWYHHYINALMC